MTPFRSINPPTKKITDTRFTRGSREKLVMQLYVERYAQTVASQSSSDGSHYREHDKAPESGAASDVSPTSIMCCYLDIVKATARRKQEQRKNIQGKNN